MMHKQFRIALKARSHKNKEYKAKTKKKSKTHQLNQSMIQFRSFKGNKTTNKKKKKKSVLHKERQRRATTHNRLDMLNVLHYLLFTHTQTTLSKLNSAEEVEE